MRGAPHPKIKGALDLYLEHFSLGLAGILPIKMAVKFEIFSSLNSKKVTEIKDCYNNAIQNACIMHRERRKFLRSALRELVLLCADQPGLLGPKALFVFMGLCFARDEVRIIRGFS